VGKKKDESKKGFRKTTFPKCPREKKKEKGVRPVRSFSSRRKKKRKSVTGPGRSDRSTESEIKAGEERSTYNGLKEEQKKSSRKRSRSRICPKEIRTKEKRDQIGGGDGRRGVFLKGRYFWSRPHVIRDLETPSGRERRKRGGGKSR